MNLSNFLYPMYSSNVDQSIPYNDPVSRAVVEWAEKNNMLKQKTISGFIETPSPAAIPSKPSQSISTQTETSTQTSTETATQSSATQSVGTQTSSTQTVGTQTTPSYRKYYPVPPLIPTVYEYQNVNYDPRLRKQVTEYFYQRTLNWLHYDPSWKSLKKIRRIVESRNGIELIFSLLKLFKNNSNLNWYDLRDNEPLIKEFLKYKLKSMV